MVTQTIHTVSDEILSKLHVKYKKRVAGLTWQDKLDSEQWCQDQRDSLDNIEQELTRRQCNETD